MERTKSDKFTGAQITSALKSLPKWKYDAKAARIEKTYTRKNFLDASAFIQQIAGIAEHQDHHPDILLSDYKNVKVMISTHSAGGITQNDFDLARAIEKLAA